MRDVTYQERAALITALCGQVDDLRAAGRYEAAELLDLDVLTPLTCEHGTCDHYTCTEGRSLDEWQEPEPTRWDYESEAFGPTARDAHDFLESA